MGAAMPERAANERRYRICCPFKGAGVLTVAAVQLARLL
jgi:hypothetical protein